MSKKIKIVIIILLCLFVITVGFNLFKYVFKDKNITIDDEEKDIFINIAEKLKSVENLTVTKDVNYKIDGVPGNEHAEYNIDLNKIYVSCNHTQYDGQMVTSYLIKEDNNYYLYIGDNWSDYGKIDIGFTYYDDFYEIIKLLENIESYEEKDDNTYKLNIKESVLSNYLKMFTSYDSDPGLPEILWLDYRKKDINKIGIYVTLTSDNNDIKEIMFDFSEIDKRSPFYTIYYSNYNNVNVKIPSNVLAKLF